MTKHHATEGGRSWRTFFIYAFLVLFFILASFAYKTFMVLQKGKFDGENHFVIAITKKGRVEEIVAYRGSSNSLSLLKLENSELSVAAVGRTLGVIPDGVIQVNSNFSLGDDVVKTIQGSFLQYGSIKTDLTIFDIGKLLIVTKNISSDNTIIRSLKLPSQESDIDKMITSFFADTRLISEGVNIQIVNASNVPGTGKRLERVLTNLGANVVSVSTAHKNELKSYMEYSGEQTYTLKKIGRLLGFSIRQKQKEGNGEIIISIGEDVKKTSSF